MRPQLEEYRELISVEETRLGLTGSTRIADVMLSDAASIVQGLLRYEGHQNHVNDKWMEAYAALLWKHTAGT